MVDVVGVAEIADHFQVKRQTVAMWNYRGLLPAPEPYKLSGRSVWRWSAIVRWAKETGRMGTKKCPDCGTRPGAEHLDICDVPVCPETGKARSVCRLSHTCFYVTWLGHPYQR